MLEKDRPVMDQVKCCMFYPGLRIDVKCHSWRTICTHSLAFGFDDICIKETINHLNLFYFLLYVHLKGSNCVTTFLQFQNPTRIFKIFNLKDRYFKDAESGG